MIGIDASRLAVAARTGTEQYTWELLAALAQVDMHTPYRLYVNGWPRALPPLGPNFSLRNIPLPRLWTHLRLGSELLLRPPATLFVPAHVLPVLAPVRRGMRTVVTIHDLGYLHVPQAHTPGQRMYLDVTTRWATRAAGRLIAISQATRDDLVRQYGARRERITVVYHGVAARFQPAPAAAVEAVRARHGLVGPYLLAVGTIQPRKNYGRLIEAFQRVAPSGQPLQLVIAGRHGWRTAAIERALDRAAPRVRVLGYVPDADLPALYAGAVGLAFPSLYEGFGMPVLEAMACGCAVLCARTPALQEVAGNAALFVDPESVDSIAAGLQQLLEDDALRADLRARGQIHAAAFTWERCALQTRAVLME